MKISKDWFRLKGRLAGIYIFSVSACLFCITNVNAQTKNSRARAYYLDSTGNDENSGTKESPWRTIEKINTIHLRPGDSLLFKAGQVFKGILRPHLDTVKSFKKTILITTDGNGMATIDAGDSSAIILQKANLVTLQNLKLTGAGRKNGNTGDGIALINCKNISVKNIDVGGFRNAGVNVYASFKIRLVEINAHDNGFAGISVLGEYQQKNSCSNIYIGFCRAENNPGSPVIFDNHSGNGIIAGSCSKVRIEYCIATNNGWDMPRIGNGPVGIWCYEADSVVIQHCISYRNKTSVGGDDGGGFDFDGGVTNSILQYCLSYENQGSGYGIFQYAGASAWHHNVMRYNISENDGTVSAAHAGIFVWNSSDDASQFYDCVFYNNTIYNTKGSAINYASQSERKRFSFYNNIFVAGDSLLRGKRMDDIFLANNWHNLSKKFNIEGITSLEKWAKKSKQEMLQGKLIGLNIDPRFIKLDTAAVISLDALKLFDRYKIPTKSALRKKGLNLRELYGIQTGGIDFTGQPAPAQGIGACF